MDAEDRRASIGLSSDQIAAIERTVRRVPEVMVKVLPKDSNNLRSVSRHLNYIGRYGNLELETDDGERVQARMPVSGYSKIGIST